MQVEDNPHRIKLDEKAIAFVKKEIIQNIQSAINCTNKEYVPFFIGRIEALQTILANCGYDIEFTLELKPID